MGIMFTDKTFILDNRHYHWHHHWNYYRYYHWHHHRYYHWHHHRYMHHLKMMPPKIIENHLANHQCAFLYGLHYVFAPASQVGKTLLTHQLTQLCSIKSTHGFVVFLAHCAYDL